MWSSLVFDYVARQKLSGTEMTYSCVKQLACPTPATFAEPAPWQPHCSLADWVVPYVLELSYTSWRLQPYAQEMGDVGPPFRWDPERRALLRADLDAAFLHVYGLTRPEAEHVLDSFFVVRKYEERDHGEYRTGASSSTPTTAWRRRRPVAPPGPRSRHPRRSWAPAIPHVRSPDHRSAIRPSRPAPDPREPIMDKKFTSNDMPLRTCSTGPTAAPCSCLTSSADGSGTTTTSPACWRRCRCRTRSVPS